MVLAVLLSRRNRTIPQDSLIDAVWAGEPPEAARSTLQGYIYGLRQELGGAAITRQGDGYRVDADEESLDAVRFEHLVDEGRQKLDADPAEATLLLEEALALWYGTPYGDLGAEPALAAEVARLEELRVVAVEHRLEAQLAKGHHRRIVGELQTLVRDHPYRESLHGMLMLAMYRSGRQAEALRAYQHARLVLGESLGIEPSLELRDLEQRILEQDPDLHPPGHLKQGVSLRQGGLARLRGYELREVLGEGDHGIVYRAFHPAVGREVAVKALRAEHVNRPDFIRRFEAEAQRIAQMEHPHIVQLYDFWRDPDGAYLVMPLLRGSSVADSFARGHWDLAPALRLIDQIGSALGYAHRQGVVHRDIKPGNVLLDEEGNAYLSDFGLASHLTGHTGASNDFMAYLPPEQARGEPLTHSSDIFSLGTLIYELLAGVRPLESAPLLPLAEAQPGLPMQLDEVLHRARDGDPTNRYDRVEDLLRAIRRAVGADVVSLPGQLTPPSIGVPPRNPYKGLRSFLETDALDFHGRDALIDELLEAVATHSLVAVVGPSGSGKSSVVRAGLIPSLRRGDLPGSREWLITDMFPGSYPFEELETGLMRVAASRPARLLDELTSDKRGLLRVCKQILPHDETQLVLIIDQFEELFSAVSSEDTRRLFLESLVAVAGEKDGPVKVVITLRADFFDRPLEHPKLGEILTAGLVTVSPPSEESLAQAIAAPARGVGVDLEPGLVRRITADVARQPGGLPLLQYALTELFARRRGEMLTIVDYESTGGVLGALGRRAEELYVQLTASGEEAARQLFLRLVTLDETAGATRRRVRQKELKSLGVDQRSLDQVLQQFGAFRLLSFDRDPLTRGPTVEVAHEALLREWDRLRNWIDSQREQLAFHRRLAISTNEWIDSDKDPGFLLRGGHLELAERWALTGGIALSADESEYLQASVQRAAAKKRAERRRRRSLVVTLLLVLMAVTSLAVVAIVQRNRAEREAHFTVVRQLSATAETALSDDPELAILLALEAVDASRRIGQAPQPAAVAMLHRAVQASRVELRLEDGYRKVAVTPDGSLLITDTLDRETTRGANAVLVRDADTGEPIRALAGEEGVVDFALSPDGRVLAVGYRDWRTDEADVVLWDPASGEEMGRFRGGDPIDWSPDGELLLTAIPIRPGEIAVAVRQVNGVEVSSFSVGRWGDGAFVDPTTIALGDPAGKRVDLHDALTGQLLGHLDTVDLSTASMAVDHIRNRLVVGDNNAVQVWDVDTRSLVWSETVPNAIPVGVSGATGAVASAGDDGKVRIHDPADGSVRFTLVGHGGAVDDVIFYPDGDRLASVAVDGETRVWDITPGGGRAVGAIPLGPAEAFAVMVSPDGSEVAVGTEDARLRRFDTATGAQVGPSLSGQINWWEPAPVSPDWRLIAAVDDDRNGWVYELTTGKVVSALGPCDHPRGFSPDGSALVVDGLLLCESIEPPPGAELHSRVIDPTTGGELLDLGPRGLLGATSAVFNPAGVFEAGRYLAINLIDIDLVELYDMTTGELVTTLDFDSDWPLTLAFDPTGKYLAGGNHNGRAWVLDVVAAVDGIPAQEAFVFHQAVDAGGLGAVINADGVLATYALDSLRLWDIHTGAHLIDVPVDTDDRPFAAFNPAGDELFYADGHASPGYTLRRFPLDMDRLVELAESRLTRDLTDDECRRFLDPSRCGQRGR